MGHNWFDHTADLGLDLWADSGPALFAEAAAALGRALAAPLRPARPESQSVTATGVDCADLMVNWLRALLILWTDTGARVVSAETLELSDSMIIARVHLDTASVPPHDMRHDIKAVTYHQARVSKDADGRWTARIIFDV